MQWPGLVRIESFDDFLRSVSYFLGTRHQARCLFLNRYHTIDKCNRNVVPSSRCLAGALNGNIGTVFRAYPLLRCFHLDAGVMKSTMAELTDETNIAQAFRFMPVVYSYVIDCLSSLARG